MNVGTQVLRKGATLDARVGTIERIASNHAYVRWPAPRRIGGEFHHSRIALKSLIIAEPAEVERRRAAIAEENARRRAEQDARFTFICMYHKPTGRTLKLQPSQVRDGRCYYCGGEVRPRTESDV